MGIRCSIQDFADRDMAVLQVQGEMDFDVRPEFQKQITELLASPRTKLVVDLSRVSRMSSVFIGTILDQGQNARTVGKSLSAVMVERLAGICRDAGLTKTVNIIVSK